MTLWDVLEYFYGRVHREIDTLLITDAIIDEGERRMAIPELIELVAAQVSSPVGRWADGDQMKWEDGSDRLWE